MVQYLGFAIYRALDWGLDESEERELSPQLEKLIDLMADGDSEGVTDEGYDGPEDEDEEGQPRLVRSFSAVLRVCASRLPEPHEAQTHYQAVCRALFAETVELRAFLREIRETKETLMKLRTEETEPDGLVNLQNTDWTNLWVQLMRDLRQGVQLKKVREKTFNSLPTEYQLTPFEMLMQDIRAQKYKLRKVMVGGNIPLKVKKDAHEVILDFIRSRPPLKPVSSRNLSPLPLRQRSLHEKMLDEIKKEPKLRPVDASRRGQKGFGSLPCIVEACSKDIKSTSCINLSIPEPTAPRPRPRKLLKAPTLEEMEEMNLSEEDDSPNAEVRRVISAPLPLKRDRSFSEQDLVQLQTEMGHVPQRVSALDHHRLQTRERSGSLTTTHRPVGRSLASQNTARLNGTSPSSYGSLSSVQEWTETDTSSENNSKHRCLEFSHPVDTLALTVEEVINVRRVLVKAEMEKFLQTKELYSNLKKGKICCCCQVKFPLLFLFSRSFNCLFCKRSVCAACNVKMKLPAKKLDHIPVYTVGFDIPTRSTSSSVHTSRWTDNSHGPIWRNVQRQFPHIYAQGFVLKDVCTDCAAFIRDVVSSSRKSVDILNIGARSTQAEAHKRTAKRM
ncbi:protein spire homolog 2 isoform X2 [Xenopus laevis]|nr:protein spire homolog 2 isoform X2 [Xenopus laevis]